MYLSVIALMSLIFNPSLVFVAATLVATAWVLVFKFTGDNSSFFDRDEAEYAIFALVAALLFFSVFFISGLVEATIFIVWLFAVIYVNATNTNIWG